MAAEPMFPDTPVLRFYDPLGDMLGAGDGIYQYSFDDAVKLAGHACPTVAGAFVMVKRAVELLYGDDIPRRGDLRITVHGAVDEGTNGPFSQILTLLTGAAADNGFHGLGRLEVRKGLLRFDVDRAGGPVCYTFELLSSAERVTLVYDPSAIPAAPGLSADMRALLTGEADAAVRERFRNAWRERVLGILMDGGNNTVSTVE